MNNQSIFYYFVFDLLFISLILIAWVVVTQPMFKVNKRNTKTRREICSKITIKTPERHQWRCSGVFIVNFERISHLIIVFLLLGWGRQMPTGYVVQLRILDPVKHLMEFST